jgi:superoxide dismutase, Fe-Mn family
MKYEQKPLPYSYDALEPYIDAVTMEVHYTKHHAGYVAGLNAAFEQCSEYRDRPLEEILSNLRMLPEDNRQAIRNFGGGHLNHALFWEIMGPGCGGEPSGKLAEMIKSSFGSFTLFRKRFSQEAMSRFGSGWAWLGISHADRLEILSTPNQDSPLMLGYQPVLGLDVWEHAYYLKYQNRRAEYVEAWWNLVNWARVGDTFTKLIQRVEHA